MNIWSVFVNSSGEWKLGAVEYVTSAQDTNVPYKIIPSLDVYNPPEKNDPAKQRTVTKWYFILKSYFYYSDTLVSVLMICGV